MANLEKNKGYYYDRKRDNYRVQFTVNGKRYRLGRYATEEVAHAMYLTDKLRVLRELKEKQND